MVVRYVSWVGKETVLAAPKANKWGAPSTGKEPPNQLNYDNSRVPDNFSADIVPAFRDCNARL